MKELLVRGLSIALAAVIALGLPAVAADQPKGGRVKQGDSTIEGDVLAIDGKPAAAALITAVHLEGSKTYMTAVSPSGHFKLSDIPHGYYELAIALGDKLHVGSVPVVVSPGGTLKIDVVLNDTVPVTDSGDPVVVPILNQTANAGAEVKGLYQKPFFKTKTGIATIIGTSLAALLILK